MDRQLAAAVATRAAESITVRIPASHKLPETAPDLLESLNKTYLALANRELTSASARSFAESLTHLPDQEALHRAFQEKNDTLKLQRVNTLFRQRKLEDARRRAQALLADPDSAVETKFWAHIALQAIDFTDQVRSGRPQSELHNVTLAHAKALQGLTASGSKHLKFYSLIARQGAELGVVVHQNLSLSMALRQHLEGHGNPMMVLHLYARCAALTRLIGSKYNRCVRLARYASVYPNRWALGRALTTIVNAVAPYLITLRAENNLAAAEAFAQSALQICKLAAWIGNETRDANAVAMAILSALTTVQTEDSDAYRWAYQLAQRIPDAEIRADISHKIERASRRWKGERVEGDYDGDVLWQAVQNIATALGIDVNDQNDPLVRGLGIAARDSNPERVLAHCEHLLVGQGAVGPAAREIMRVFNVSTAGSKVIHCTLHDFHIEGKELDTSYDEFKRVHCDSCPDQTPRPESWRYTDEVRRAIQARYFNFLARLAGTPFGLRYTNED